MTRNVLLPCEATDANSGAETEAEAVLQMSRTVEAFASGEHGRLEGLLVCYGRAVIHHGWPMMKEDEEGSPVVTEWGTRFREEAIRVRTRPYIQFSLIGARRSVACEQRWR